MTLPRSQMQSDRAVLVAVSVTGWVVAMVDLVAGVALQVTDISLPRVAFALGVAWWAHRESRRDSPRALLPISTGAIVVAAGSFASLLGYLPFGWYDRYTTYSLLVGTGIVSATLSRGRDWTRWVWPLAVGGWAFAYSSLDGSSIGAAADWMIVAGATVATLHYLVGTLVRTASSALDSQTGLTDLHRVLSRCSHFLLEDASESAMDQALEALLEATDADYACVDQTIYDSDPPGFLIVAEAASRPLPDQAVWMDGSYRDLPTTLAAHLAGEACEIQVDDLSGEERRLYQEDGIRSELSVPIMVDGTWRGSMVLASFTHPRVWSSLEVEMLVQAAGLIGAYWRRQDDRRRLEELIRSKDELIASVSHELRTPLTGVVGLAEEMASASGELDAETMGELAGLVADQSRELAYLVEDLLVAARMETGALSIQPVRVSLLQEAQSVVDAVMGSASVQVEGWDGKVRADPVRCRQILRNLLTNAERYGGDRVTVTVVDQGRSVLLIVADDGDGVPVEDEERIFHPYFRSRTVVPGSIGVGLAVSRNLARLMGGTLEYGRRGEMTEFRLVLPHARDEATGSVTLAACS